MSPIFKFFKMLITEGYRWHPINSGKENVYIGYTMFNGKVIEYQFTIKDLSQQEITVNKTPNTADELLRIGGM